MKPIASKSLPARGTVARCHVVGWAAARIPLSELPDLRQQPLTLQGAPLAASLLKHVDEQTLAGLSVVAQTIADHDLVGEDFTQWGVIAAPRFLGRATLAVALARFAAEGAWGISPHLIPHRSLHSLSGTISQSLKIHGPNYGVGGGADGAAEALLAAGAILAGREVPGLWVILTGFDPELVPSDPLIPDAPAPETDCVAVALALAPARPRHEGRILSVAALGTGDIDNQAPFSLEEFADTLQRGDIKSRWRLRCGGWAAWKTAKTAVEISS